MSPPGYLLPPAPPAYRDARLTAIVTGAAYGVLAVFGLVLGVVGAFHSSWTISGIPVVAIIATVVNLIAFWTAGWAMKSKVGSLLPAVSWLVAVLLLSTQQREGDLIVTGSSAGEVFLIGGSIAAAVAVGLAPATRLDALATAGPGVPKPEDATAGQGRGGAPDTAKEQGGGGAPDNAEEPGNAEGQGNSGR